MLKRFFVTGTDTSVGKTVVSRALLQSLAASGKRVAGYKPVAKGSKEYASDNVGKKVTVPTHYYKAVLRYSKNSTFGHSGYIACAILLEHRGYGDNNDFKPYAMSIDELEKKIGIDLFANLPAVIGDDAAAKVEAEDPTTVSWWW